MVKTVESRTYVEQGFLLTVICIMDAFTVGIKSRIQVPAKPGKPAQRVNLYDVGKLQSINVRSHGGREMRCWPLQTSMPMPFLQGTNNSN